ncbi:MAG TPA: hypothetical protein VKT21_03705 [Thermoplasmata archaeon]|nr:hypothetical protein [Thermoplasmata archaeon]
MSANSGETSSAPPPPAPRYRTTGYLPKLEGPLREQALKDPGPTWGEWLIGPFAKVWLALGLFVVDSWLLVLWAAPFNGVGMVASLAAALYLEFLLWRYLWFAPDREEDLRNLPFRPNYAQLTRFGRWTPQAQRLRAGQDPYESYPTDDMTEFVG